MWDSGEGQKERGQSEIRKTSCPSRYAFHVISSHKLPSKPRDNDCEHHASYTEKSEPGRADSAGAKQGSWGNVYDFALGSQVASGRVFPSLRES